MMQGSSWIMSYIASFFPSKNLCLFALFRDLFLVPTGRCAHKEREGGDGPIPLLVQGHH